MIAKVILNCSRTVCEVCNRVTIRWADCPLCGRATCSQCAVTVEGSRDICKECVNEKHD